MCRSINRQLKIYQECCSREEQHGKTGIYQSVSPGGNTSQPADDGSGYDPGEGSGFDLATTDPPATTSKSAADGFGEESSLTTTAPTGNDVEDGSGLMTYTTTIIPEEARQGGGQGLEGDGVTTMPTDAYTLAAEEP